MIKQATLPFATRLARSLTLSGTAVLALGGMAGQANAAPPAASSAVVTNGSLVITEDDAGHTVQLALNPADPNVLFVITDTKDVQDFDRTQFTQIVVTGGRGDDTIQIGNGFADELVTVDGGPGDDTITGGDGNDLLRGGNGNDVVNGGRGADTAILGNGSDSFIWNPGDGSDVVIGQHGSDTMVFNGANIAEHMAISANGSQSVLTRDVGRITMNMDSIEGLDLRTLGGADVVDVGDLSGTDLANVDLGLAGSSGERDGVADQVTVFGTDGNDNIKVRVDSDTATVRGLQPSLTISGADPRLDHLQINALGGLDKVSVKDDDSSVIQVSVDLGDQHRSYANRTTPASDTR
jgi:hypothetical protein